MKINIKKLNKNAIIPTYGSEYAAGADLYACVEGEVEIKPHTTAVIPTGVALELPLGYANKVGVVDCDYRGEVKVALHNHSDVAQCICAGERIAQLVITPYITAVFEEADELSATARGAGGFGSTGSK